MKQRKTMKTRGKGAENETGANVWKVGKRETYGPPQQQCPEADDGSI